VKVKVKVKSAGNGRNLGKLAQLMSMPLDVFFEITEQLEPFDILQLSRVSKRFRSTFASKHSRHIWVAARRNISMPECPSDLTELQYASLMFEQTCQACGSRAYKVDYSLRLRLCGPCFETNVKVGSKVMRLRYMGTGIPDLIFTLLPRSSLEYSRNYSYGSPAILSGISDSDAKTNGRHNAYYVPELEMVIKRYQALTADPTSLGHFVKQQQTVASQMMKNARLLTEWVTTRKVQKVADKNQKALESCERMANREASIEAKLLKLGWEEKDLPSEWDSKWRALVKQPHELTPQIWKVIQPKLVGILEDYRRAENQIIIRTRRDQREREFEPFWDEFVLSYSWDSEKLWALPRFVDACDLPVIDKMLAEDESSIQVTAQRWLAVVASVPDEMKTFADRVMHDVVRLLKGINSETNKYDPTTFDNEEMGPGIFKWASSLLSCGSSGCKNLFTFPEILQEEHVTPYQNFNFQDRKWPDLLSRLRHEPEVFSTVSLVLKNLGLPDDTPLALFDAWGRKFICLCGNPQFLSFMDFQSLIRHLTDENITYESQVRTQRETSYSRDLILNNDHDLTGPQPCFALFPFTDLDISVGFAGSKFHMVELLSSEGRSQHTWGSGTLGCITHPTIL